MKYIFSCLKCNEVFEISCSIKDLPGMKKTCPACHSNLVKRVYGKVPIIYRGGGFYNTDNKTGEGGKDAE